MPPDNPAFGAAEQGGSRGKFLGRDFWSLLIFLILLCSLVGCAAQHQATIDKFRAIDAQWNHLCESSCYGTNVPARDFFPIDERHLSESLELMQLHGGGYDVYR